MSVPAVTRALPRRNFDCRGATAASVARPLLAPSPVDVTGVSLLAGSKADHRTVPDAVPHVYRIGSIEFVTVSKPTSPCLIVLCRSRNRWRSGTFARVNRICCAESSAQFRFQHFASRVAGQRVDDLQRLRMLVPRQPFGEEFVKISERDGRFPSPPRRRPAPRPTSRPGARSPPPRRWPGGQPARSRPRRSRCSRRRR